MAADDCPGRDALSRLVELRENRGLFLDEESCDVIRGYIFRDLASLPHISLRVKIILAAVAAASLAATVYGVVMLAEWFLSFGLTGLLISFGAYSGRKREVAACRLFTCEERFAIIDEIEAAGHISAEEAIALRADVEKLAQDAPELTAPWDRAAAAREAARDAAAQEQIAASRAFRLSSKLERCGGYFRKYLFPLVVVALAAGAIAYLAALITIAKLMFFVPFICPGLWLFGQGVWMILQAYITFRLRLAQGEMASAGSALVLLSILGVFFFYLAAFILWHCAQAILK